MVEQREVIQKEVIESLEDTYKLNPEKDYLSIVEYGGSPDESYLEGSKNALRLFALDVLRVSCGIDNESGIMDSFNNNSMMIDYISVREKDCANKSYRWTLKERLVSILLAGTLFLFLISAIVGFIVIAKWLF